MDKRSEIAAVYVAGVIQGIALVTFPAAGTIFTSATHYAFSSTQYGGMFVPQAITAITAALLGAGWFDGSGKAHLPPRALHCGPIICGRPGAI